MTAAPLPEPVPGHPLDRWPPQVRARIEQLAAEAPALTPEQAAVVRQVFSTARRPRT